MQFPLMPVQASTISGEVDHLLYFLLAVAVFFIVVIFAAIFYFAIRYRRRSDAELPEPVHGSVPLEILWSVIPFGLTMVMFTWGASLYFRMNRPPDNAVQIYAVGKQWMWKLQHMEGQREINELHVPVGRPIKLTMTSEDVIHSFYVPAFRVKQDVLPGRYSTIWFQPTKPGKYHLFCAEYCGTKHSGMTGWIYVMEPQEYQAWLGGGAAAGSLADNGQKLFQDLACANCHKLDGTGRGPNLAGQFGRTIQLSSGGTVAFNEDYIRESVLQPAAKVVSGYQAIMPTFQGLVTEEGLVQLVEYIKSLTPASGSTPPGGSGVTPPPDKQAPNQRQTQPSVGTSTPGNR